LQPLKKVAYRMPLVALPDTEAGIAMAHALEMGMGARIVEDDSSPHRPSVDKRMKRALDGLKQEKLIRRKYDYIWIKLYINEQHAKDTCLADKTLAKLFFISVNSFREYVARHMGHSGIAGISTLSKYDKCCCGRFPEWTFTDEAGEDRTECLRRINLVRRFVALYIKGR